MNAEYFKYKVIPQDVIKNKKLVKGNFYVIEDNPKNKIFARSIYIVRYKKSTNDLLYFDFYKEKSIGIDTLWLYTEYNKNKNTHIKERKYHISDFLEIDEDPEFDPKYIIKERYIDFLIDSDMSPETSPETVEEDYKKLVKNKLKKIRRDSLPGRTQKRKNRSRSSSGRTGSRSSKSRSSSESNVFNKSRKKLSKK